MLSASFIKKAGGIRIGLFFWKTRFLENKEACGVSTISFKRNGWSDKVEGVNEEQLTLQLVMISLKLCKLQSSLNH